MSLDESFHYVIWVNFFIYEQLLKSTFLARNIFFVITFFTNELEYLLFSISKLI